MGAPVRDDQPQIYEFAAKLIHLNERFGNGLISPFSLAMAGLTSEENPSERYWDRVRKGVHGGPTMNVRPLLPLACVAVLGCGPQTADLSGGENTGARFHKLVGQTYTLWIHGRTPNGPPQQGNYADFSYWGSDTVAAGANKRAVNWDGRSRIADQNEVIRNALDCFCTGPNWCNIASHSAGDLHLGYALALHGGSARNVKRPEPDSNGVCPDAEVSDSDLATQTGWNINWAAAAGSAAGGSEVASFGNDDDEPLVGDLIPSTSRSLYDHNITHGVVFKMFAGAAGAFYSGFLPGEDDGAVAYHSAGGVSGNSGGKYCNPGAWSCKALTMGTQPIGRVQKWTNHDVVFRDDDEDYKHSAEGNWGGIVGPMREFVVQNAVP